MLFPTETGVVRDQRIALMKQKPAVIWLTGFSGSGKSTLAVALEKQLVENGFKAYLLDGDNIRSGLNKDLDFSEEDRHENIRRIGEVCRLMNDTGLIVITSFISPFRVERNFVRALLPPDEFIEVFLNASIEKCEERDVKGLYKKVREGVITGFTGIDSPYEKPESPELILNTDVETENESLSRLMAYVVPKISIGL